MAKNMARNPGSPRSVAVSHPASPVAGDPVRWGVVTGVALTDEANGVATIDFGMALWESSVEAVDISGDSAIVAGDSLFYNDADTPPLNKKTSGCFFGVAEEPVDSGETAVIKVLHMAVPGAASLGVAAPGWLSVESGVVIDVDYQSASGAAVDRLTGAAAVIPAGMYVERIDIVVTTEFGAELVDFEVGKAGTADWLVANAEHNLLDTAPSVARIINNPVVLVDTPVLLSISQDGNTAGAATVIVRLSRF